MNDGFLGNASEIENESVGRCQIAFRWSITYVGGRPIVAEEVGEQIVVEVASSDGRVR